MFQDNNDGRLSRGITRDSAWRLLGPGGGGAQYIPAISPHDPDKILVACDMTGAYITDDSGETWKEFNLRNRVQAFCFDPAGPGVVYAGSSGLFRSEDGGISWTLLFPRPESVTGERMHGDHADQSFVSLDNWPGGEVQCIYIDEFDSCRIYIGIHNDRGLTIYSSKDRGASWSEFCAVSGSRVHALFTGCKSPSDEQRLYCFSDKEAFSAEAESGASREGLVLPEGFGIVTHAACGLDRETGLPVFYIIAAGVWRSKDRGCTWHRLEVRLGSDAAVPGNCLSGQGPCREIEFSLLAVCAKDGSNVYAGVSEAPEICQESGAGTINSYFGVIKSTDGGDSWRWVLKADYAVNPPNLDEGWAERDYDLPWHMIGPKGVGPVGLGVCPSNSDICCATDLSSTFLTTDGGIHWKQVYSRDNPDGSVSSRGLEVTTCYGVHFDPFDREHIAVSYTDTGIFHSYDRGHSWLHPIRDLPPAWGNTCYWIVFDPLVRGRAWSALGGAHDLPRPKMFKSGAFHLYQGGICKSDDGMVSWRKSNCGMPGNCVTTHIILDESSPAGNRTLYAAAFDKGVYKSADDGLTWQLKNIGIRENLNAWRLVLLPDGTLYLLVMRGLRDRKTIDGALYKSIDGAERWEKVNLPYGVNAPNDLIYDPGNPERMYLACWPDDSGEAGRSGGLYETCDGGRSWCNIFDPSAHVYAAAVHPGDSSVLFAVTFDSAAWFSEDRGGTWQRIRGYDFKWGHRPIVDPCNSGMLYITTFGSSIWHGPWRN